MVAGGCSRCWLFVYLFIFFMIIFKLCLVGWLNAGVRCVWRTSTIKIETNSNLLRFDGAIYIPPYDVCVANQSCFFAGVFYWRPSIIFRFFFLELMFMTLWYNNNVRSTQYTHTWWHWCLMPLSICNIISPARCCESLFMYQVIYLFPKSFLPSLSRLIRALFTHRLDLFDVLRAKLFFLCDVLVLDNSSFIHLR